MTTRRSHGDGGLHWDETRQRWIATVTIGYTPTGKRIVRRASRSHQDRGPRQAQGPDPRPRRRHGLRPSTATPSPKPSPTGSTTACPAATAPPWTRNASSPPSTSFPRSAPANSSTSPPKTSTNGWSRRPRRSAPARSPTSSPSCAERSPAPRARDKVRRNVVLLCGTPTGQTGRPSKALTLEQAHALVEHAGGSTMGAYVLMSLLTGARTEELRALTWSHVDLNGSPTPTRPSRPTSGLALGSRGRRHQDPHLPPHPRAARHAASRHCIEHRDQRQGARRAAGERWIDNDLVFAIRSRHPTRCGQRPARVPPHRHRGRSRRRRMDTARTTPQLRIAAVRQGRADRADRPPRRAHRRVDGHRDRLPQATAPGHQRRRRDDERAVSPRR